MAVDRWPFKRCMALGFALGLLTVTIIAVATGDAASAALGGAFTVFLAMLVIAPVWDDEDAAATECSHCPGCSPPHHDFCGSLDVHGEHPMETGRLCCGRTP